MQPLKKILCIDDDPDILSIIQLSLTDIGGFDVRCCDSGINALRIAENFIPQVFLIDVMMPNMSGPETLIALHKNPILSSIPAIFLTANTQFASYFEAHPQKVLGFLAKPFDPIQLHEKINKLWNKQI